MTKPSFHSIFIKKAFIDKDRDNMVLIGHLVWWKTEGRKLQVQI